MGCNLLCVEKQRRKINCVYFECIWWLRDFFVIMGRLNAAAAGWWHSESLLQPITTLSGRYLWHITDAGGTIDLRPPARRIPSHNAVSLRCINVCTNGGGMPVIKWLCPRLAVCYQRISSINHEYTALHTHWPQGIQLRVVSYAHNNFIATKWFSTNNAFNYILFMLFSLIKSYKRVFITTRLRKSILRTFMNIESPSVHKNVRPILNELSFFSVS